MKGINDGGNLLNYSAKVDYSEAMLHLESRAYDKNAGDGHE